MSYEYDRDLGSFLDLLFNSGINMHTMIGDLSEYLREIEDRFQSAIASDPAKVKSVPVDSRLRSSLSLARNGLCQLFSLVEEKDAASIANNLFMATQHYANAQRFLDEAEARFNRSSSKEE